MLKIYSCNKKYHEQLEERKAYDTIATLSQTPSLLCDSLVPRHSPHLDNVSYSGTLYCGHLGDLVKYLV